MTDALIEERGKRIGEVLLETTSLQPDQLQEALDVQNQEGGFLGEILVRKGILSKDDLLKALCLQIGLPFLSEIDAKAIDIGLVEKIPINYAKSKELIPLRQEKVLGIETVVVALSDPFSIITIQDLIFSLGKEIRIVVSPSSVIQEAINRVYERSNSDLVKDIGSEFDASYDLEGPIDILEATEDDAPVIKFVNSLLFRALKEKASDIHIEPFEKEFVVRFRVDGVLYDIIRQPKRAHPAISSRIKVMGMLDIAEKRMPQDGRIKIKIAGKDIDIRLSTVPTHFGERIVMRILEQSVTILDLEQLGFRANNARKVEKLIFKKHGIILVTGPTGSGKSTTLSACLVKLNSPTRNIMTVEDPIEYQIPGINQVQVNAKIDLTFSRALRAFLRQNPDVIMVGEIRDKETAEIAINASLTGHLVLSTLHTNDAASATTRLVDMGIEPFLIASSLVGVVAQRLIRRVCQKCCTPFIPDAVQLAELGLKSLPENARFVKSSGCSFCSQSGYSGRTVIHELLVVNDQLQSLITKSADAGLIKHAAIDAGMLTLREDGVDKVIQGITTMDELIRATQSDG
jgi:general secretion pathway protein E